MKRLLIVLAFVALAQATTVSSITCAGQTATVNSTAHGLIASQGFSLSGTSPTFNSTASTVTANAFTFVLPAGTACSGFTSGYSAVAPAKQIIDTFSVAFPGTATVALNYVYWFTTVYPNPICTLAGVPIPPYTVCPVSLYVNATAAEQAAILAGTTVEVAGQLVVPAATPPATVQTTVISQYNAMQVGFAGYLLAGGYFWNGSAWANH